MDVDALPENNYRYIDATITLVYSPGLDSEFVACGWSADTPRASRLDNLLIGDLVVPVADISHTIQDPVKTYLNIVYASLCAGSFTFGSSRRS